MELLPFKQLISEGVKAIMTAHIIFPAYEPENCSHNVEKSYNAFVA